MRMPAWAVSCVPPHTMPRVPQIRGRCAKSPCGPGVDAKDWVAMRVFLHQITGHETYTGDILVYNTTFRGAERSNTNVTHEEAQPWREYRMSSGSNCNRRRRSI